MCNLLRDETRASSSDPEKAQADTTQESLVLAIFKQPLSAADADWILASGLIKRLHAVARRRSDPLSQAALHAITRTAVGLVPAPRPDESVLRVVIEQLETLPEVPLHACRMLQLLADVEYLAVQW